MRCPAILATISLIVFASGLVVPATAQLTQNNNLAGSNGQNGSILFTLKLDEQSLQDLRNGQSLLSEIPVEIRDKITHVRLDYVSTNTLSSLPTANPNGVSTGQQFGPPIPDFFRNQFGANGNQNNRPNAASGNSGGLNNSFPQSNSSTNWNNNTPSPNPASNSSGNPQFIPPLAAQPSNTNFQQNQPATIQNGLSPIQPRNEQIPAWNAPNFNNPANGQGTGNQPTTNQPNFNTPAYNSPGTNSAPPFRPTNDSYNQNQAGPNHVDTARQNPGYNPNLQNTNANSSLQPIPPNRYAYDLNGNPAMQESRMQQPTVESLLGNMQLQIDSLAQQYPGNGQRTDAVIAGHQYPTSSNYSFDPGGYGFGNRGLLASIRGSVAQSDPLPSAFIPGNASNETAVGQQRETASIAAAVEVANRKNAFLFFWLMCSIGLNIYLGWISRGFYVRYRELADELRETFSTV